MNCLNCSRYLGQAMDSVFAQTYKDWEIIFWDNASTDNSFKIASSYGEKVKRFKSEKTYPLGKARNLAIEQSSGEFIAFLDCDDIWLSEKLEKQIPIFNKDSKIGLVFSDAIYFNKKGDAFQLYGKRKPPENYVFRQMLAKNFLCLSSVIVKKETIDSLNEWFDPRFNCIEDADLFLRISYNWKAAYAGIALAKYRMHEKSLTYGHQPEFSKEHELLAEKILGLYPNLAKEYSNEVKALKIQIGCRKFISHWSANEVKEARKCLKPFLWADKKLFLPYIFSYFFSFSFFAFLLRVCKRRTYSS